MATVIQPITGTAERLYELRQRIAEKEEENRRELEALKAERDAVQAQLLADLNKNKISSIKVASGESFARGVRRGVDIINPVAALQWAVEHRAIAIDRRLVAQQLKDVDELPHGFKAVETEFISVRKPTKKHE